MNQQLQASTGAEPRKSSNIDSEFNEQGEAITFLATQVTNLLDKLNPILLPPSPEKESQTDDSPTKSMIAERIAEKTRSIRSVGYTISQIIERVDV